jgi:RNA polymerase subunit RPABC4/transcription elongation factor Spt4
MECQECGREIPEDAFLCPYCGARIKEPETQQCRHCDREIPFDAVLCPYCGKPVAETDEEEEEQDRPYLSSENAVITKTRAVIGGKTYAMGLISSVQMVKIAPKRTWPIILLAVGILGALGGFASGDEGGMACGGIGLLLALAGGAWLASLSDEYAVRISAASGEVDALKSKDKASIQKVVDALSQAITERG